MKKIMKNTNLDSIISDTQLNFIYVYDFLKLWTFFIEVIETCDDNKKLNLSSNNFFLLE